MIYKKIKLLDGKTIDVLRITGFIITRALYLYQFQGNEKQDLISFFIQESCIYKNKKRGRNFYLKMDCTDYLKLMEAVSKQLKGKL